MSYQEEEPPARRLRRRIIPLADDRSVPVFETPFPFLNLILERIRMIRQMFWEALSARQVQSYRPRSRHRVLDIIRDERTGKFMGIEEHEFFE